MQTPELKSFGLPCICHLCHCAHRLSIGVIPCRHKNVRTTIHENTARRKSPSTEADLRRRREPNLPARLLWSSHNASHISRVHCRSRANTPLRTRHAQVQLCEVRIQIERRTKTCRGRSRSSLRAYGQLLKHVPPEARAL